MDANQNSTNETAKPAETMGMAAISEFHQRLAALETEAANLRDVLSRAREQGDVPYPGFVEHVAHVMRKHFFHDKPDGFDAKYGE